MRRGYGASFILALSLLTSAAAAQQNFSPQTDESIKRQGFDQLPALLPAIVTTKHNLEGDFTGSLGRNLAFCGTTVRFLDQTDPSLIGEGDAVLVVQPETEEVLRGGGTMFGEETGITKVTYLISIKDLPDLKNLWRARIGIEGSDRVFSKRKNGIMDGGELLAEKVTQMLKKDGLLQDCDIDKIPYPKKRH